MNDSIFVLFFLNEMEGFVMNEKSKISINRYILIVAAILVLDILTIITNIYISPVLENFWYARHFHLYKIADNPYLPCFIHSVLQRKIYPTILYG